MTDLFKKINTLVKSSLNDLLGEDFAIGAPRRRPLDPRNLGKDVDREIAALRQRINEAVTYEEELRARVRKIQAEVAQWDLQADEAVAAGNDASARHAIEQMQRAQQRLMMADSDLQEHQLVTQELIQRVNALEAAVADARRAKHEESQAKPPTEASEPAEQTEISTPRQLLSDVLKDAREKITRMGDLIAAKEDVTATHAESPADETAIDDDLAERRQRLSKPK